MAAEVHIVITLRVDPAVGQHKAFQRPSWDVVLVDCAACRDLFERDWERFKPYVPVPPGHELRLKVVRDA